MGCYTNDSNPSLIRTTGVRGMRRFLRVGVNHRFELVRRAIQTRCMLCLRLGGDWSSELVWNVAVDGSIDTWTALSMRFRVTMHRLRTLSAESLDARVVCSCRLLRAESLDVRRSTDRPSQDLWRSRLSSLCMRSSASHRDGVVYSNTEHTAIPSLWLSQSYWSHPFYRSIQYN